MIDASQIMPLNFFMYKGVYSGEHHGMRYRIKKAGEKPDEVLEICVAEAIQLCCNTQRRNNL